MRFVKEISVKGAFIPLSALEMCDLKENDKLELHTLSGIVVLTRRRMTAAEIVETIQALTTLSTYFINHLGQVCGSCQECGGEEGCPCDEDDYIELPDYLREEAGIPSSDKLCAEVDKDAHSVTVQSAGYRYDLRDVPEGLLTVLRESGICLGELEDQLMSEAIIYG